MWSKGKSFLVFKKGEKSMKRSKFMVLCVVLVAMLCGTAWSAEWTDEFFISGSFDKGYTDTYGYSSYVTLEGMSNDKPVFYKAQWEVSGDLPPGFHRGYYSSNYKFIIDCYSSPSEEEVGTYEFTLKATCGEFYTERKMSIEIVAGHEPEPENMYLTGSMTGTYSKGTWYTNSTKATRKVFSYEGQDVYDEGTGDYVGTTYSLTSEDEDVNTTINVYNASGDFTFSVSGDLPQGMYVRKSDSGLWLEGSPVETGNYKFVLKVSDENTSAEVSNIVSVTTPEGYEEPTPSDSMIISGDFGAEKRLNTRYGYWDASVYVEGASGNCTWSIVKGDIPSGLYLHPDYPTLYLRGTPDSADRYSFTLRVVDSSNNTYVDRDFSIWVWEPEWTDKFVISGSFDKGYVGTYYNTSTVTLQGMSGDKPVFYAPDKWELFGNLPEGFDWNSYSYGCNIYRYGYLGTEDAGTYNFTLRATCGNLYTERKMSITIADTHEPASGDMYLTGTLSETLDLGKWYEGTGRSHTESRDVLSYVYDEDNAMYSPTTTTRVDVTVKHAIDVHGVYSDYTFTVTSGDLPRGMYIRKGDIEQDSNGGNYGRLWLEGTPVQSGDFTFVVKIADGYNSVEVENTVTVTDANYTAPANAVGSMDIRGEVKANRQWTLYSGDPLTLTVSGDAEYCTWSVISGDLPSGLYMDPSHYSREVVYEDYENGWYDEDGNYHPSYYTVRERVTGNSLTLRGTPAKAGRYKFTIRVVDNDRNWYVDKDFSVWVWEPEPTKTITISGDFGKGYANNHYSSFVTLKGTVSGEAVLYEPDVVMLEGGEMPYGFGISKGDDDENEGHRIYLRGYPYAAGTYNFTLGARWGNLYLSKDMTVTIAPVSEDMYLLGSLSDTWKQGKWYEHDRDDNEFKVMKASYDLKAEEFASSYSYDGMASHIDSTIYVRNVSGDFTFDVASRDLPPGMYVRRVGSSLWLEGTPIESGDYSFVVHISDDATSIDVINDVIIDGEGYKEPADANGRLVIVEKFTGATELNEYYDSSVSVNIAGDGNRTWSWVGGEFPSGLYMVPGYNEDDDRSYLALRGTPDKAGRYNFTLRVVDDDKNTYAEKDFAIWVWEPESTDVFVISGDFDKGYYDPDKGDDGNYYSSESFATFAEIVSGEPVFYVPDSVEIVSRDRLSGLYVRKGTYDGEKGYGIYLNGDLLSEDVGTHKFTLRASWANFYTDKEMSVTIVSGSKPVPVVSKDLYLEGSMTDTLALGTWYEGSRVVTETQKVSTVSGYSYDDKTGQYVPSVSSYEKEIQTTIDGKIYVHNASGNYTFSVDGTIPPGMYIREGVASLWLEGTPIQAGKFTFTVKVSDDVATATLTKTVTISDEGYVPPTLASDDSIVILRNFDGDIRLISKYLYSLRVTVDDRYGDYTWSLLSNDLPSGWYMVPGYEMYSGYYDDEGELHYRIRYYPNLTLEGYLNKTGKYHFTLRVVDNRTNTYVDKEYTIFVWEPEKTDLFVISGDFEIGYYDDGTEYSSLVTLSGTVSGEPVFYEPDSVEIVDGEVNVPGLRAKKGTGDNRYKIYLEGEPTIKTVKTWDFTLRATWGNLYTERDMTVTILEEHEPASDDVIVSTPKDLYLSGSLTDTLEVGRWYGSDSKLTRQVMKASYDYEVEDYVADPYDGLVRRINNVVYLYGKVSPDVLSADGLPDYTFSVDGTLPNGMYIRQSDVTSDDEGNIRGTLWLEGNPTKTGEFKFDLKVTDGKNSAEVSNDVIVTDKHYTPPVEALGSMAIAGTFEPEWKMGESYESSVTARGAEGTCTWSWVSGDLPAGLYLVPTYITYYDEEEGYYVHEAEGTTLALTGIPSKAGTYTFKLRLVDNETNRFAEREFTVKINDGPYEASDMTFAGGFISEWMVSRDYSSSISVWNDYYAGTLSIDIVSVDMVSGDIPTGLSLKFSSPVITLEGTPEKAGEYTFALRATDSRNAYIQRSFSITIYGRTPHPASDMRMSGNFTPVWETNEVYSSSIYVNGYTGAIDIALISGDLPLGLSLSTSGSTVTLSGIPNTAGEYTFVLRAIDSRNAFVDSSFTVKIVDSNDPKDAVEEKVEMWFEDDFELYGRVNESYASYVYVNGSRGKLRPTVVDGQLPPGLSLSSASYAYNEDDDSYYTYYDGHVFLNGIPNTPGTYKFTLRVTDSTNVYIEREFTVIIEGLNRSASATLANDMTLNGNFPDAYTSSTWYSSSVSVTGGRANYTFEVTGGELPDGFHIRQDTDRYYYAPSTYRGRFYLEGIPRTAGKYTFTLKVTDSRNTYAEREFTLNIISGDHFWDYEMSITGSFADTDTTKLWYSSGVRVNDGWENERPWPSYTFSVTNGDLPPGFSIKQSGEWFFLEGIPTTPGTYTFTLQVTDSRNGYVEREFTMTIEGDGIATPDPADSIEIITEELKDALAGKDYSDDIAVEGVVTSWRITSGYLPAGLELVPVDSSTGQIRGTVAKSAVDFNAEKAREYPFDVTVTNDSGGTDTRSFLISVSEPIEFAGDAALPVATAGNSYIASISVNGTALDGIEWEIMGLPDGLVYSIFPDDFRYSEYASGRTCFIRGVPTYVGASANSYNVQVRASSKKDGVTVSEATREFALIVTEPVEITTEFFEDALVGMPYSQTIEATGGVTVWEVEQGELPLGLSLNAESGIISGTVAEGAIGRDASAPRTYTFTVKGSNSLEGHDSRRFTITVSEPMTFDAASALPNATVGDAYSATISAHGTFTDGISWKVEGLPAGLTYGDDFRTLTISGTPTVRENRTYSVNVTVSNGLTTAEKVFPIAVEFKPGTAVKPQIELSKNTDTAYAGSSYNVQLSATGTTPITWAVDGKLPGGLLLDPSGKISGTVQASAEDKQSHNPKSYSFTINATNRAGTDNADMLISVLCPPEITTGSTLRPAVTGRGYKAEITADGTEAGMSWSMTAGQLPNGLTMSASKNRRTLAIAGTPTVTGTFNFTLTLAGSTGLTPATKEFTLVVGEDTGENTGAPTIETQSPLPDGETGVRYVAVLDAEGTKPITWSKSGTLPKGLTLSENGIITGVPTKAKTYKFTVIATNSAGTARKSVTITITGEKYSKPKITTSKLPNATHNEEYEVQLTCKGTAPITWSFADSKYPEGLYITEDGRIAGIPKEAGSFKVKVKAENEVGSVTKSYTLKVNGVKPTILTEAQLPSGTVKTQYQSVQLSSDGTDPITWSKSGKLPSGIKLNTKTGVISGTPKKAGSYTFKVTAKNKYGKDTRNFTVVIAAAETASDAPETKEALTENVAVDENVAVEQPAADTPVNTPEVADDYSLPETDMSNAEIDLCVVSGDEELRGEIYAPEGQPLTFRIGGDWPTDFEDAEVFIADEAIALEIAEDGTFVLPGELVSDEFVIYVMAGNTKTIELYVVAEEQQ